MMQPSENPYRVLEVQDRIFDVRTTLSVIVRFGLVGLVCGLIAGIYMEQNARTAASTGRILVLPGLLFGVGIMGAALAFVRGRRIPGCLLFPFLTVIGFGVIGGMFDIAASTWAPSTPRLILWMVLAAYSSPGVVVLMVGCVSVATPKSWLRFVFTGGVICLMAGVAPLVTNAAPGLFHTGPRFFITMFVVQLGMFLLFGWVLGDTIADDHEWTRTPE